MRMRLGPLTTAGVLVCALLLTGATADAKQRPKKKGRNFSGYGMKKIKLRTEPVPQPSGDIWIYAVNFREEVRVNIYRKDKAVGGTSLVSTTGTDDGAKNPDRFDEQALAALDNIFRCKRTGEVRAVDPRLYETLSVISDHFGGKRVDLISGFRFQREEGSRHYHASAMDIRIRGVSPRELRKYAESLDTGGMGIGIYPRANFVHVDWRAPGEPSYRWVDKARARNGGGKRPSRRWKKRPQS